MRPRTLQRAAVLLLALAAVQCGASALADGQRPHPNAHSRSASTPGHGGRSGSVNPLESFQQGASMLAGMAAPFMNAASNASDRVFPRS